ncbi:hypothetical protein DPMN_103596 [Dreissena polymorpha]|uniref:Uncharacterized protein n=1 Tax=Dreissena polymorpha TaxID=45954 RepID=A0A9D4IR98_DREPO|nr:hypothetical protein DPMN_163356 [Dreissena polymorpha]KAH3830354.1 hypothetical protein DPMN_103596 [Dreissena polymorpha]
MARKGKGSGKMSKNTIEEESLLVGVSYGLTHQLGAARLLLFLLSVPLAINT